MAMTLLKLQKTQNWKIKESLRKWNLYELSSEQIKASIVEFLKLVLIDFVF